jgi:phytoene synthase
MHPSLPEDPRLQADFAKCAALIRTGSRSFYMSSLLLPRWVRKPAYAIYAFCRISDDAVDDPGARADAVELLRARLARAYASNPDDTSCDRAIAATVKTFAIPQALPEALLEGLAWDGEGRRFATLSDLYGYAARVASAVGAMMTVLMGVRDQRVLARACDLGVAMQLTKIARDVGEDARNGRVYLPLTWLAEMGIDPAEFVASPVFDERIAHLVARLLDLADHLYARSASGINGLPMSCRPAIHAARLIYREIGQEVKRAGYDSVSRRAVVADRRKLMLLGRATGAAFLPRRRAKLPALDETKFLVDAVEPSRARFSESDIEDRLLFVVDLMGRLGNREKEFRARERAGS